MTAMEPYKRFPGSAVSDERTSRSTGRVRPVGEGRRTAEAAVDTPETPGPRMHPHGILAIENSIGLSGSTISLTLLLNRLDPQLFEPSVVLSRPEQLEYVRSQLNRRVDATVIAPRRSLRARPWAKRLGRAGRRALAFLDLFLTTIPYVARLYRFAKARNISLIHQNNGFDVAAILLSRLLGIPIICYQRGNEWNSPVVRRLAPHVTRYLANSETTKCSLVSLGVAPEKIRVVYPPIEITDFKAVGTTPATRADFGVLSDAPCFGIVGQLLAWKGQVVFLKAAKQVLDAMPEARAWVIGGIPAGGERYASELRELAATLGIEDKVIFTGFVRDVPATIGLLDVVIHASLEPEPFGRVIVESMALRRPVIATDAGGPREIIEHGRTGFLLPPGNHELLAEQILTLLNDSKLAATVGEAGYHAVAARFSAKAHAKLVQAAYTGVLDSPRRDPAIAGSGGA